MSKPVALAALIALVGIAALFSSSPAPARAAKKKEPRWLTLEIYEASDGTAASSRIATYATLRTKLSGHQESRGFADATDAKRVVNATIWSSREDLENASLALDGTATQTPGRRLHFREVRSSTFDKKAEFGHLEFVVHRTRPGVTRKQNLNLFDKADKDFAKGEGLIGHSLWISADGVWLHRLRWKSAEDYSKTGKGLMGTPGVGGWIKSLDFKRFEVLRGDVR